MLTKNLLLERSNTLGGLSLVLASKGVAKLREWDISAVEGYDMSSIAGPQFFHRTVGTCFLVDRSRNHEVVFGEYAINRNWSPVSIDTFKAHYKKVPDGLTVADGSARGYAEGFRALDWIEVESAFKAEAELLKIIKLGLRLPEPIPNGAGLVLDQVVFVYDTRQGHESRILRTLRAYLRDHPEANDPERLSHLVFARAHIDIPLQWHGVTEHTAWELLSGMPADEVTAIIGTNPGYDMGGADPDMYESSPESGRSFDGSQGDDIAETPSSWGVLRPPTTAGTGKRSS